jgi:hypothetical protein
MFKSKVEQSRMEVLLQSMVEMYIQMAVQRQNSTYEALVVHLPSGISQSLNSGMLPLLPRR